MPGIRKKGILFILHLPPPIYGASLAGKFIQHSKVINEEFDTTYINLATNTRLAETGKFSSRKLWAFIAMLYKVIGHLIKLKPSVCYMTLTASGPGFYKDLIVVALLKLFRKKIVYHFHNKGVSRENGNWLSKVIYRWVFRGTKVILLSTYVYADVSTYFKDEDIFYCPNGIPAEMHDEKELPREARHKEPCRLLFLSNMMKEKGVYVLLEALIQLRNNGVPFECHFVGGWTDIKESDFREDLVRFQLEGNVWAHGPKYDAEKFSFFREADIFIFPTFYHYETFPIVILEAMQYSLPVISTPEGGIPEEVIDGETGLLVPQRNVPLLVERITTLIQDPVLRRRMGDGGRKHYEANFTLASFEQRMTSILQIIVGLN